MKTMSAMRRVFSTVIIVIFLGVVLVGESASATNLGKWFYSFIRSICSFARSLIDCSFFAHASRLVWLSVIPKLTQLWNGYSTPLRVEEGKGARARRWHWTQNAGPPEIREITHMSLPNYPIGLELLLLDWFFTCFFDSPSCVYFLLWFSLLCQRLQFVRV